MCNEYSSYQDVWWLSGKGNSWGGSSRFTALLCVALYRADCDNARDPRSSRRPWLRRSKGLSQKAKLTGAAFQFAHGRISCGSLTRSSSRPKEGWEGLVQCVPDKAVRAGEPVVLTQPEENK